MTPGAFTPDRDSHFYLLRRHRQPLAANVAARYIEEFSLPGDLVVDPFCASATVARTAAELGRRAIAVDSNPLIAFAARVQATLPPPRDIATALARLGEIRKEDEPLKRHIEQLYASVCSNCNEPIIVDYWIISRDLGAPLEKIYHCPTCGDRRDPATEADRTRSAEFEPRGFQYHLLLTRLASDETTHSSLLRQLLQLYTARNLYALVTLTLKFDAEFQKDPGRELLAALLLHALDVGTSLYPEIDALPLRQTPETFVEMNMWTALEQAAEGLSEQAPGAALAKSPEDVTSASGPVLYIGHGSARSLAETIGPEMRASLALSSPARLDPRFWEQSYLWSRWLLGASAARSIEPLLDEERQRWGWYGSALASSLRETSGLLKPDATMAFAFPSGSHAMIEALCLAASPVFQLETFSFRPHAGAQAASEFGAIRGDYRVVWSRREEKAEPKPGREVAVKLRRGSLIAASEVLKARGEPLGYSWLHHNALKRFAFEGVLSETLVAHLQRRDNPFQFLRREIEAGLKEGYARDFDHWKETGRVLWLRRQSARDAPSLADRVEQAVGEIIRERKRLSRWELEDGVLDRFPELLTPEPELIEACAAACADAPDGEWCLRAGNETEALHSAEFLIARLGAALNFDVRSGEGRFEVLWRDQKAVPASSGGAVKETLIYEDAYGFVFFASPDLRALLRETAAPLHGLIVIPETRVQLVREKLRRSPTMQKMLEEAGWEFLRLPFVELLLASSAPERAEFQLAWGLDPPLVKGREQLGLF